MQSLLYRVSQNYVNGILYNITLHNKTREEVKLNINTTGQIAIGILIPFIGTTLRFSNGIFIKKRDETRIYK